ncbi:DNA polymerase III subunit gamma/tau [Fischerella sp. NIES-4106]|nr:DNA polymerase III subunit gamma/tau [Fischerella sp. NIES-4106]
MIESQTRLGATPKTEKALPSMSYEPLHHKYRPKSFAELVGQEAIATTLTNAIRASKIAPAYLFTGPRGTGKTSSARILAKSLNCLKSDKPTAEPCGVCDVCQGITKGYSLDVIEIDAASNTGVDNIREMIERAQFAPVQCRYKVYVVDECLTGDSLVLTDKGLIRIDNPKIKDKKVLSYNDSTGQWEYKKVTRWLDRGERQTLVIKTTSCEIKCTGNHLIRTDRGWIAAKDVKEGMRILSPANADVLLPFTNLGQMEMDASGDLLVDTNLKVIPTGKKHITLQWTTSLETVESVSLAGVEQVYDIEVADNHNFVANGLLVHNCHMLSTAAFNALLKTLEEPPKHVVFVLATTDPQRVLPTIISRCQRFDFRRIPLEAMVQHLNMIATKENININWEAITLVAQIAQGGLRDAESLLDQLSLLSGEVTPDRVWDLVGSVSEKDLLTLLSAIAKDNPEAVLDCTRQILDRGREPLIVLQNLAAFYRDLLIAKTAPNRQNLVACTPQTWQALVNSAQNLDTSTILQGQQHLRTAEVQLKNTTQPRLWLEVTLLGLLPSATIISAQPATTSRVVPTVSPTPFIPPSPVSNGKVTQGHAETTTHGHSNTTTTRQHDADTGNLDKTLPASSSPTPSTPPTSPSSTEESLEGTWQKIVEYLPIPAKALLNQHGRLLSIGDGVAVVGVPPKLMKLAQGKLADVEAAFVKVFQQKYKVSLVPNQVKTSPSNGKKDFPQNNTPQAHQPSLPSYNQPQSPVAENHQPVKPLITKTESSTNPAAAQSLPTPQHQMSAANWESDEGAIAAQRLAQFFDGAIIRFADDVVEVTDSNATSDWENEAEDEL